ADLDRELRARRRIQLLRIVDAGDVGLGRKHHRRGDHGARERRHTRLVDAGDVADARFPQQLLEVAHRIEALALVAGALAALPQRLAELADALAPVALQTREDLRGDRLSLLEETLADLLDREVFDACHGDSELSTRILARHAAQQVIDLRARDR